MSNVMSHVSDTIKAVSASYLHCHRCGKQVSTGFYPIPTDTPDGGLIVRAWIECPECIENAHASLHIEDRGKILMIKRREGEGSR